MRKLTLMAAALAMLTLTGVAVARGLTDSKGVKAVAATFTATAVANSQTRSCVTADGKTITSTSATYTGTASGDADLTGVATLQVRSTINTTDGLGAVTGRLKIAAAGGETTAQLNAVYDHGTVAGFASGHAAARHVSILGNVSASFSDTAGFSSGKIGGGTAGGTAVETGSAKCSSSKPGKPSVETSDARGTISAVSSTSVTVGVLTCTVPSSLSEKTSALKVGDRAGIKCSLVSGVNTLVKIDAKK